MLIPDCLKKIKVEVIQELQSRIIVSLKMQSLLMSQRFDCIMLVFLGNKVK